jgi:YVTN family beta-propeller protein
MIATLMRMIRWTLMTLIAFGLLLYSSGPWVVAPDAHAHLAPVPVVAIAGVVVGVLGAVATIVAAQPRPRPSIEINTFSLAVGDDFNVGDCGTVNLRITVNYGSIADRLSRDDTGKVFVEFFADGQRIGEGRAEQTGEPTLRSYTFTTYIIGTRPGTTHVWAKIRLHGQISGWLDDDWTWLEDETPRIELNVKDPYEVWIDGPRPKEITHGETTTAKLKARVRTQNAKHNCASAEGLIGYPTQLDGQLAPPERLRGADNAGHSYETDLVVRKKSHEGCPYAPPHPPFVNLLFQPNSYELDAFFAVSPYIYEQRGNLEPVDARDYPLPQPSCQEGEEYDPKQCRCVKKTGFSISTGTGGREPKGITTTTTRERVVAGSYSHGLDVRGLEPKGAAEGPLIVVNNQSHTAALIEPRSGQLEAIIGVGTFPVDVAADQQARRAYTANFGSDDVSVIDLESRRVTETLGVGRQPSAVAFDSNTSRLFVANFGDSTLSIFESSARGHRLVATLSGIREPLDVAISPDGRFGYVVSILSRSEICLPIVGCVTQETGGVLTIDLSTLQVIRTVRFEGELRQLAVSPDGRRLYVTARAGGQGQLLVLDAATGQILQAIPVGQKPYGVAVSPEGCFVVVANAASHDISVVDAQGGRVVATLKDAQAREPWGVVVLEGSRAYVTNRLSHTISVFGLGACP